VLYCSRFSQNAIEKWLQNNAAAAAVKISAKMEGHLPDVRKFTVKIAGFTVLWILNQRNGNSV